MPRKGEITPNSKLTPRSHRFRFTKALKERLNITRSSEDVTHDARSESSKSTSAAPTPSPHESPLRSPAPINGPERHGLLDTGDLNNSTLHDYGPVTFAKTTMAFAVDRSGSTGGLILAQEISVIRQISMLLEPEAIRKVNVLPWSHKPHNILSLQELDRLESGGGTAPTVLNEDATLRFALRNASLWCLLTDGEIEVNEVQQFASGIGTAGLHGTAAVVVLAGYLQDRPTLCNISVGKSVYAVASDCIFVFHDVRTGVVYILQCKGCFRALLPPDQQLVILEETTAWNDLPRLEYSALATIEIPAPRALAHNKVALTSGKVLDLEQIYDNTLSEELVAEVLGNNDNLTMLLLTASTRGRRDDVKGWIAKKKIQKIDPVWAKRPDTNSQGLNLTAQIISLLHSGSPLADVRALQVRLQHVYLHNWRLFAESLISDEERVQLRDTVISDATARLVLEARAPASPMHLSPVSPALSSYAGPQRYSVARTSRSQRTSMYETALKAEQSLIDGDSRREGGDGMGGRQRLQYDRRSDSFVPQQQDRCRQLLYTTGYKVDRDHDEHFHTNCEICGETSIAALLLRTATVEEETAGFPAPGSRSKHVFPMVLGACQEADILVPEICCETCSVFLLRNGMSRTQEKVIGTLPLVSLSGKFSKINMTRWTETLADAFQWRIDDCIVLQVFLAALYTTIDELSSESAADVQEALRGMAWACKSLVASIQLPMELVGSPKFTAGAMSPGNGLGDVLANQLDTLKEPGCALLTYPMDGFVALMRAANDLPRRVCSETRIREAIWLRLLFGLTERRLEILAGAPASIMQGLTNVLNPARDASSVSAHDNAPRDTGTEKEVSKVVDTAPEALAEQDLPVKATSISLSQLEAIQILSSDTLEALRQLGSMFPETEPWLERALAVFSHALHETAPKYKGPQTLFDDLKAKKDLRPVFWGPEVLDAAQTADMISRIYSHGSETKQSV